MPGAAGATPVARRVGNAILEPFPNKQPLVELQSGSIRNGFLSADREQP
jgi:hypothetical protein